MSSRRAIGYFTAAAGVVVLRLVLQGSSWHSSPELHTLLEALAALIAIVVGAVSMLRFHARKTTPLLIAGIAFCGTALLDAFHTAITSSFVLGYAGSLPAALVPWSWFLARLFLASLLALRARTWTWPAEEPVRGARILATTVALTALCAAIVLAVPLPPWQFPELLIPRPQELLPGALLAYALLGHLRAGAWREDPFEHALIFSMILSLASQILFMSSSAVPHDAMFDAAHVLKFASKGVVLVGLLASTLRLFRVAELDYEERTFGFLENLPIGVFILDAQGRPYYANRQAVRILGHGADPGLPTTELARTYKAYVVGSNEEYPADRMPVVRALQGESSVATDMEIRQEGRTIPLQVSAAPVVDRYGKTAYALSAFQDVGELRRTALEDPLTGLANRLAFHEAYGRMTAMCWRAEQPISLAVIDLDHFKRVNDTHGHEMGDLVLQRTAAILSRTMRATDLVARWGGEEMTVLLPGVTPAGAAAALERSLAALREERFGSGDRTFSVTFSAGVVGVERGTPADRAVAAADRLLYVAKQLGRNRVCGAPDASSPTSSPISSPAG